MAEALGGKVATVRDFLNKGQTKRVEGAYVFPEAVVLDGIAFHKVRLQNGNWFLSSDESLFDTRRVSPEKAQELTRQFHLTSEMFHTEIAFYGLTARIGALTMPLDFSWSKHDNMLSCKELGIKTPATSVEHADAQIHDVLEGRGPLASARIGLAGTRLGDVLIKTEWIRGDPREGWEIVTEPFPLNRISDIELIFDALGQLGARGADGGEVASFQPNVESVGLTPSHIVAAAKLWQHLRPGVFADFSPNSRRQEYFKAFDDADVAAMTSAIAMGKPETMLRDLSPKEVDVNFNDALSYFLNPAGGSMPRIEFRVFDARFRPGNDPAGYARDALLFAAGFVDSVLAMR